MSARRTARSTSKMVLSAVVLPLGHGDRGDLEVAGGQPPHEATEPGVQLSGDGGAVTRGRDRRDPGLPEQLVAEQGAELALPLAAWRPATVRRPARPAGSDRPGSRRPRRGSGSSGGATGATSSAHLASSSTTSSCTPTPAIASPAPRSTSGVPPKAVVTANVAASSPSPTSTDGGRRMIDPPASPLARDSRAAERSAPSDVWSTSRVGVGSRSPSNPGSVGSVLVSVRPALLSRSVRTPTHVSPPPSSTAAASVAANAAIHLRLGPGRSGGCTSTLPGASATSGARAGSTGRSDAGPVVGELEVEVQSPQPWRGRAPAGRSVSARRLVRRAHRAARYSPRASMQSTTSWVTR